MNKPRLLDQVRDKLRLKHYGYRTEQSYIAWIKRFIFFHDKWHPNTMGEREIELFLAVKRNVTASAKRPACIWWSVCGYESNIWNSPRGAAIHAWQAHIKEANGGHHRRYIESVSVTGYCDDDTGDTRKSERSNCRCRKPVTIGKRCWRLNPSRHIMVTA